jgi:predicted nucleic acid-binding protein
MTLLVDTTAFYALADESDKNHKKALAYYKKIQEESPLLLTTNYILSETYTLIRVRLGHRAAITALEGIRESDLVEIVYGNEELDNAALDILRKQRDKDYSYADAVSFALMELRGITEAFTFDSHFRQFGFQMVP